MIPALHEPIDRNWTIDASSPVSAAEIVAALGVRSVADLRPLHPAIVVVAADLAASAGIEWTFGPDDAPVALLRALGHLARRTPNAASSLGASLLAELP